MSKRLERWSANIEVLVIGAVVARMGIAYLVQRIIEVGPN
jgi:hypothetical protein